MRPLRLVAIFLVLLASLGLSSSAPAAGRAKPHTVGLGSGRRVPYSIKTDPAGALAEQDTPGEEKTLRVRPLVVDDKVKEWTTGEPHDVTDRSFVVRRALRLNDALPGDKAEHWIWQRGPWLMIDRTTGHILALKLPDYDPAVSTVVWFRDYAAYCGLNSGGKQLYAVVAQVGARKPILSRKLAPWSPGENTAPACARAAWQRDPLRVTFQPQGADPVSFDLVGLSAVLVEDGDSDDGGN
jgi:hypothetical protein